MKEKEYELKFCREWYDALAEMTHEDRAEAVLSLLEYAYEDKIPDDKFIRIVTTLMRNKIMRDKSRHNKRNSSQASTEMKRDESTADSSSEMFDKPISDDNSNNSDIYEISENSRNPTSPGNNENNENPQDEDRQSEIETIIQDHFSDDCHSFVQFCKNIKVNKESAKECGRKFILEWIRLNPDKPIPIPVRKPGRHMSPIDQFIHDNAKSISEKPSFPI